ncbi:hypothetical protein O9993_20240 [Vibrio lentus]|nr:hypothetical protein [Vibrio lentus]
MTTQVVVTWYWRMSVLTCNRTSFSAGSEDAKQQTEDNADRLSLKPDALCQTDVFLSRSFGRTGYRPKMVRRRLSIRIDDTIVGLEGVLTYSYGEYRLVTTKPDPAEEPQATNRTQLYVSIWMKVIYVSRLSMS